MYVCMYVRMCTSRGKMISTANVQRDAVEEQVCMYVCVQVEERLFVLHMCNLTSQNRTSILDPFTYIHKYICIHICRHT
jgi:hypothetical protein